MKTQPINSRFRVASENLQEIASDLIDKNYNELDPCSSGTDQDSKILIDKEKKTFYFLDDECLEESKEIISEKFNTSPDEVSFEEIKNWR